MFVWVVKEREGWKAATIISNSWLVVMASFSCLLTMLVQLHIMEEYTDL